MESYSKFYEFISEKLGQLSENGQLELIASINACINYFGDSYASKLNGEDVIEGYKGSMIKMIEAYKFIFKLSLKAHSAKNLKLFAERRQFVKEAEVNFICREFAKSSEIAQNFPDLCILYMKLIVSISKKNSKTLKIADSNSFTTIVQVFCRRFLKFTNRKDTITGLGLILESISIIKASKNPELIQKIEKMIVELYAYLRERPDYLEELIDRNLFHNNDLNFFRIVKLESNLNLVKAFKSCIQKQLSSGHEGTLLETADSRSLLDLYMKLAFGDFHDVKHSNLSIANESDLLQYEIFSKLAVHNLSDSSIEALLNLCSKSYFISETSQHAKFTNLVKLSLLSRTSDGLDELLRRHAASPFTVASLCFISNFPFSLWKSSDKLNVLTHLISELLVFWKILNRDEASIDLLALIISALSNLIKDAFKAFTKEDFKEIISFLPVNLRSLRNNTAMNQVMKHKLATAIHRLLRGLLSLEDAKVIDILDSIAKLGSTESCASMFDTWESLSLFPFLKNVREQERVNKTINDRVEMIIPKLFSLTENMSSCSKLLIQHHFRHSLQIYMRYIPDMNFLNNPVINSEKDQLQKYIQDPFDCWSKGVFDSNAEEEIWNFIYDSLDDSIIMMQSPLRSLSVQISPLVKSSSSSLSVLQALRDDFVALHKYIEEMKGHRDDSSLEDLHQNLQSIIKLRSCPQ